MGIVWANGAIIKTMNVSIGFFWIGEKCERRSIPGSMAHVFGAPDYNISRCSK